MRRKQRTFIIQAMLYRLALCLPFLFLQLSPSHGAPKHKPVYATIVLLNDTSEILHAENPDKITHPASLTKMMTLFLLFDALAAKSIKLTTRMTVSAHAAAQAPSKLGLRKGQKITVNDAMLALIVKSANDAAVVIAEHLAKSEPDFAKKMTAKAKAIGLKNTVFKNASGLPHTDQVTTARDMATLGLKLYKAYPSYYRYFKTKSFMFGGQTYRGHNRLVGHCTGVDGIKTGYINASGFNLVSSAERQGVRIFAAVLGGKTGRWRDKRMEQIINATFPEAIRRYKTRSSQSYAHCEWQQPGYTPPTKPLILEGPDEDTTTQDIYLPEGDPIGELLQAKVYDTPTLQSMIEKLDSDDAEEVEEEYGDTQWISQFGAFKEELQAQVRLEEVLKALPGLLGRIRVSKSDISRIPLYRPRLESVTKVQAEHVCQKLRQHEIPCLALKNTQQLPETP